MKSMMAFLSVAVFSNLGLAGEGFSPEQLVKATDVALKSYAAENSAHGTHVTGFKTWKSGAEAKVKIYIDHNGMAMESNYVCQEHSGQVHCSGL